MKKTLFFIFSALLLFTFVACSPFGDNYVGISSPDELEDFLENNTEGTFFAYLENDITVNVDADADKGISIIEANGNKFLDLNGHTITLTVSSSDTYASTIVARNKPNYFFAPVVISQGADVTFRNGGIKVSLAETIVDTNSKFTTIKNMFGLNIFYISAIQNEGNLTVNNVKIDAVSTVTTQTTGNSGSVCFSGIYNRYVPTTGDTSVYDDTDGTKKYKSAEEPFTKITCEVNRSIISVKNEGGEANGIMSWQNTDTTINRCAFNVTGKTVKGVYLCAHDLEWTKDYPGTVNVENTKVSLNAAEGSAHAFMLLTGQYNTDTNFSFADKKTTQTFMKVSDCNVDISYTDGSTKTHDLFKIQGSSDKALLYAENINHNLDLNKDVIYSWENCVGYDSTSGKTTIVIDSVVAIPQDSGKYSGN